VTVALTGGSGVVGGAVLRHLLQADRQVTVLTRDPTRAFPAGVGTVSGHLGDYSSLVEAFHGAEVVYHIAGLNRLCTSDPSQLYRVNVDGTRNVVRACRATGVRRLVYTSSAATIGEPRGTIGREDSPHRGSYLSHYERSKHFAEQVVFAEAGSLEVVAVNPSSVQGPGRSTGTARFLIDLIKGRLPFLVHTRLSIIDIDDCAHGHLLAEERGRAGERYLLNGFSLPIREAVALLEEVSGARSTVRYVPLWTAAAMAAAVESGARLAGRSPPICREMVRTLAHGHAYDGSKATRELGLEYRPAVDTRRRLVSWLEETGLV
jgi:dihydroflavonol-4-reductase